MSPLPSPRKSQKENKGYDTDKQKEDQRSLLLILTVGFFPRSTNEAPQGWTGGPGSAEFFRVGEVVTVA